MIKIFLMLIMMIFINGCTSQKMFYIKPKSIKTYKELTIEYYKAFEVLENNNLIKEGDE